MSRPLRVGLVGAGIISSIHLPNLRQLPGVEIAAVCDADEARARGAAAEYGGRAYTSAEAMLEEAELDALFVCTPAFARGDLLARAARGGLHLYVEKPPALDLGSALATAEAVEGAGVVASVGHMWRYSPAVKGARTLLGSGPALLAGRLLNGPPGPAWALDRELSGGLLVEFGTHMLDLLRFLGGEVTEVSGAAAEVRLGPPARGPDSVALTLRFASGAVGGLQTSWASPTAVWDLEIVAPEARLTLELGPERLRGEANGEPVDLVSYVEDAQPHGWGGPSWFLAVRAFVEAVRRNEPGLVLCPYREGVRTLALALAAGEAVRTGRLVAVERV